MMRDIQKSIGGDFVRLVDFGWGFRCYSNTSNKVRSKI